VRSTFGDEWGGQGFCGKRESLGNFDGSNAVPGRVAPHANYVEGERELVGLRGSSKRKSCSVITSLYTSLPQTHCLSHNTLPRTCSVQTVPTQGSQTSKMCVTSAIAASLLSETCRDT